MGQGEAETPLDGETRYFRWWSTPDSAAQGVVSVLAVVETLVAVSISIWCAWHFQTVTHIVLGAIVAPLLLLRTDASSRLAMSWFVRNSLVSRLFDWLESLIPDTTIRGNWRELPLLFASAAMICGALALTLLLARVFSTAVTVVRSATQSLRAVPFNWKRICLCTDVAHPPEVLPGIETIQDEPPLDFQLRFSEFMREAPVREATYVIIFFPIALLLIWLPSYVYRLSLKATSIVYLPFLFTVSTTLGDDLTADEYIDERESGAIERLQWWYSILVVVVTLGSIVAVTAPALPLQSILSSEGIAFTFLRSHYLPTDGAVVTIKGWHIARLANAGIVVWLFYFARRAKIRLRHQTWSADDVRNKFELFRNIQVGLSIYTIFCAILWLLKYAVTVTKIPDIPIEFRLLP